MGGSLGTPSAKEASIPQGDPLSMMIAALVMRPWAVAMRAKGLAPYRYVDDLLLMASGPDAVGMFAEAMDWTMGYLKDMGGGGVARQVAHLRCQWGNEGRTGEDKVEDYQYQT